jgi:hypothetical protein
MIGLSSVVLKISGREINGGEIAGIQEVSRLCGGLSREELSHTVCEHLGWVTASGRHKVKACLKLLEALEEKGLIELPAKQERRKSLKKGIPKTARTAPRSEIGSEMPDIGEVALKVVSDKSEKSPLCLATHNGEYVTDKNMCNSGSGRPVDAAMQTNLQGILHITLGLYEKPTTKEALQC